MTGAAPSDGLAIQQLVRYEALFKLLEDIQMLDVPVLIAQRAATQWKYFAVLANWRLVLAHDGRFITVDANHGEASIADLQDLSPWDRAHWDAGLPNLLRLGGPRCATSPGHLLGPAGADCLVLPFVRAGRCVALLTVVAHKGPFSDLDKKFIRLVGGHLADRLLGLALHAKATRLLIDKATHDRLTGLSNRGAIVDHLGSQLALARRTGRGVGVILADIDYFKAINDAHGHLVGDAVLRELARRLMARARDGNGVGRYGGEEFLFVLYPCNPQELAAAAERFLHVVAETPFHGLGKDGADLVVTISLGTASTEGQGDVALETLLNQADEALYRSKAGGRNRVTPHCQAC